MTDYYARTDITYTGGDTYFTVPFEYIDKDYISVYINDVETENFTWNTSTQIVVDDDLSSGDVVSIRRTTPIDERLVEFSNSSILDEDTLNLAQDQLFDVVQEMYDTEVYYQDTLTSELTSQFEAYTSEINENIEEVLEAAEKLDTIDEAVETAQEVLDKATELLEQAESYATMDYVDNALEAYVEEYISEIVTALADGSY